MVFRRASGRWEINTDVGEEEREQCAMKIPQFGYVWSVGAVASVGQASAGGGVQ